MTPNWFMVGAAWVPFFVVSSFMLRRWHLFRPQREGALADVMRRPADGHGRKERDAASRDTLRPPAMQQRARREANARGHVDVAPIPRARVPHIELPVEGCMEDEIELPRLVFEEDYSEPPPSFPRWSGQTPYERH